MATAPCQRPESAGFRSDCGCSRRPSFHEKAPMDFPALVDSYGYLAVFIGAFLEGETILALAGLAAYRGYLDFFVVIALAMTAGFLGDQFYFFLGRRHGARILERFPHAQQRAQKFDEMLSR